MTPRFECAKCLVGTRQRGQAALTVVLLVAAGIGAFVYSLANPVDVALRIDKKTAAATSLARDALIGFAAAHATRPGSLPCPDTDNDGDAEPGAGPGGICPSYIGRLPWKTLGIPEPVDGSGEGLWYAVTPAFRDHAAAGILNSDTLGQLTVNDAGGAPLATQVIAIIFAPGAIVPGQVRGTAVEKNTVANYLDGSNSDGDTVFVSASYATETFNDKMLVMTSDALFNVVNIRVAKVAIAALDSYRAINTYYPFANAYGTAAPYNCSTNLLRGRFPVGLAGCGQVAWGAELPAWFSTNEWNVVTHYAMAGGCGEISLPALPLGLGTVVRNALALVCDLATAIPALNGLLTAVEAITGIAIIINPEPLHVTGVTVDGARALVIVSGRARGGQAHPCASDDQCMEDAANTDTESTGAVPARYTYVKPSRFPASNDRMAVSCSASAPCSVLP